MNRWFGFLVVSWTFWIGLAVVLAATYAIYYFEPPPTYLWTGCFTIALIGSLVSWYRAQQYQTNLASSGQNGLLWIRAQQRLTQAWLLTIKSVAGLIIGIITIAQWPEDLEVRQVLYLTCFFIIAVGIIGMVGTIERTYQLERRYWETRTRREEGNIDQRA